MLKLLLVLFELGVMSRQRTSATESFRVISPNGKLARTLDRLDEVEHPQDSSHNCYYPITSVGLVKGKQSQSCFKPKGTNLRTS